MMTRWRTSGLTEALAGFGIDAAVVASLPDQRSPSYPKTVPGRIACIDADFIAYQVSAETKAELDPDDPTPRRNIQEMKSGAVSALEYIRKMAGAEYAHAHVTSCQDKGKRDQIAILKEYQASRKNRDNKPEALDLIRHYIGELSTPDIQGVNSTEQEADDAMTQTLYRDFDNCIMCSADKDLLMVPGWRMNMRTYEVTKQEDHFGYIEMKTSGKTKKLEGRGTKFFWAQMLMGDPADNVSGVPKCPASVHAGKSAKLCGPALAYQVIAPAKNDKEAFEIVRDAYKKLSTEHKWQYTHWCTGEVVTWSKAMFSEMQLLWMRRNPDPMDVLHWTKEVIQ